MYSVSKSEIKGYLVPTRKAYSYREKENAIDMEYCVLVDKNFRKQVEYCFKSLVPIKAIHGDEASNDTHTARNRPNE